MIAHGQTGLLFDPGDAAALRDCVVELAGMDDSALKAMAMRAMDYSRTRFGAEAHYRQLLEIYKELASSGVIKRRAPAVGGIKRVVLALPVLRRFALTAYRFGLAIRHLSRPFKYVPGWSIKSRETTNFTYDLAEANRRYLAAFLADATGLGYATIAGYLDEIDADQELRERIRTHTARSRRRELADSVVRFGRRVGWFALVRAVKPRLVVETGVEQRLRQLRADCRVATQ